MLLEIKDLFVEFRDKVAVDHISLYVNPGQIVGVIGESGSGKSVTALSVMDLLSDNAKVSGTILYDGVNLSALSKDERSKYKGKEISMVFQEPMTSLNPLMRIGEQVEEMYLLHEEEPKKTKEERQKIVIETMEDVGLVNAKEIYHYFPHELSGGMRQRVMLAIALVCNPKLLIADEPTTALDVKLQSQILELLADISKKRKMAILFITHNMSIVRNFCDFVYVMKNGQIVETETPQNLFLNPKKDYTKLLISSIPNGIKREDSCDENAPDVLEVQNYSVYYPKRKRFFWEKSEKVKIVDNVSFTIKRGELLGLVGQSGCGKSTLCKGILGLQKYTDGKIIHHTKYPQMVFQDPYSSLNPKKKIGWILKEPLHNRKDLTKDDKNRMVADILVKVGLKPEVADRYPRELSGGMRQRISIAIALIQGSTFIIADEPVSALDVTVQKQILDLILEIQRDTGLSCLFISHDMNVVNQVCHRVLTMKDGKLY